MTAEKLPLDMLKADRENPRAITADALAGLGVSVEEFGDLSGIVWNERTGELVCGHQRMTALRNAGATHWERKGSQAWIVHPRTGERFPIRIVDWPPEKQRLANLTANNPEIAGEFTGAAAEQLAALEAQSEDQRQLMERLRLTDLLDELGDDAGKPLPQGTGLEEFDATPASRPTWIMIACPEDVAAELESLLRGKFADNPRVRIEKSSNAL
jgi:ParB-like chromosome segregation protein Spo0J